MTGKYGIIFLAEACNTLGTLFCFPILYELAVNVPPLFARGVPRVVGFSNLQQADSGGTFATKGIVK